MRAPTVIDLKVNIGTYKVRGIEPKHVGLILGDNLNKAGLAKAIQACVEQVQSFELQMQMANNPLQYLELRLKQEYFASVSEHVSAYGKYR